jgi:hypothetical protein
MNVLKFAIKISQTTASYIFIARLLRYSPPIFRRRGAVSAATEPQPLSARTESGRPAIFSPGKMR